MDELTSVNGTTTPASAAPSTSEQAAPTSQESTSTPQPQSGSGTTPAPATSSAAPKINLFESQEFRNWQAQQNRTLAQYQQQLADYQRQVDEARMASMDDYERESYGRQRAEAELQRLQNELAERERMSQYEMARQSKLSELAAKTAIPLDTLAKAQTPLELAEIIADYHRQKVETLANTRAAELKARQEANKPDIGGGSLSNVTDGAMRDAWNNRDAAGYIRALRLSADQ